METPKVEILLGTVAEVSDRLTYEILVDVPGVAKGLRSFPLSRGDMDEPVPGNLVYLICLDPVYHSVNLYTKLKENDFIGIRSNGKMLDLTPEKLSIGVYDESITSEDGVRPDLSISRVVMDSGGNIEIMASGNSSIKVSGDSAIDITGNSVIKSSGNTTVESPKVTITGGQLITKGVSNTDMSGPFNGIKICPFTGAPHCGSQVSGT